MFIISYIALEFACLFFCSLAFALRVAVPKNRWPFPHGNWYMMSSRHSTSRNFYQLGVADNWIHCPFRSKCSHLRRCRTPYNDSLHYLTASATAWTLPAALRYLSSSAFTTARNSTGLLSRDILVIFRTYSCGSPGQPPILLFKVAGVIVFAADA